MPKRPKFLDNAGDPFSDDSDDSSDLTFEAADSEIFGAIASADNKIKRLKQIDIFNIYPDPMQPRRTMPSMVRAHWDGSPANLETAFSHWIAQVEAEREGTPFDLTGFLNNDSSTSAGDDDTPEPRQDDYTPGPLETAFLQIVTLAASIRRDGLTNPISIARNPDRPGYLLETGERRWLAYHLLWLWFDGSANDRPDERDTWNKIPCQTVDEVSVWRQANENNARANLNAIGRARQYAVLLMDLINRPFQAINEFTHEREFYAQVSGERTPRGKGEQLLASMGVTNRSTLSRYNKLLSLPNETWDLADDLNMSEEELLDLVKKAEAESGAGNGKQQNRNVVDRNNSKRGEPHGPGTRRHFTDLTSAIKKAGRGKKSVNKKALKALDELRIWLDEQEAIIRNYGE